MPQYEIGYVTMKFFFVVQNILVDLARNDHSLGPERRLGMTYTPLLTI